MVAQPQSTEIKTLGYRIVTEDHYIKQFSTKHSKGFQKKVCYDTRRSRCRLNKVPRLISLGLRIQKDQNQSDLFMSGQNVLTDRVAVCLHCGAAKQRNT